MRVAFNKYSSMFITSEVKLTHEWKVYSEYEEYLTIKQITCLKKYQFNTVLKHSFRNARSIL